MVSHWGCSMRCVSKEGERDRVKYMLSNCRRRWPMPWLWALWISVGDVAVQGLSSSLLQVCDSKWSSSLTPSPTCPRSTPRRPASSQRRLPVLPLETPIHLQGSRRKLEPKGSKSGIISEGRGEASFIRDIEFVTDGEDGRADGVKGGGL